MRWVVVAVAALLVGLLAYGVASQGTDTSIEQALRKGQKADPPMASLPRLGGQGEGSLADYKGKVVLLNFWASWCPPCTSELPVLEKTQKLMAERDGTVLGINTRDASEDALGMVRKFDLTFPSLRDGSGDYAERWGLTGYPESFLIDREGEVVAHANGPIDQSWVDQHVTPLL